MDAAARRGGGRGRRTRYIAITLPPDVAAGLERFRRRQPEIPSTSEAARQLLRAGLRACLAADTAGARATTKAPATTAREAASP